ncbi:hypothetical protein H4W79_003344 [Nocardiopsis terrae]|uniref:Uncharacterized protein n=1 Tax=Nocardiopsis terrae TaxID=372655 RepID=A0ABR9HJE5_9ACTN|nr:hypothetical protein [Nocardiopsis terrae]MBE1459130.1 hypothetical protein [Nocardiopsis terrae]
MSMVPSCKPYRGASSHACHLTSGFARRIASLATAGAIALCGVALTAPAASADDFERTPAATIERIEARTWPVYPVDSPGPSVDVESAQHFMSHLGYLTSSSS